MRTSAPVAPREQVCGSYVTPLGAFLRRTSLDELPQLWCVLKGDMSLIGPRPLLAQDPGALARRAFPEVLSVRPGLSGLAQVSGRNLVGPRTKARYDAFYVRRRCLAFDIKLMWRTVALLIVRTGDGVL